MSSDQLARNVTFRLLDSLNNARDPRTIGWTYSTSPVSSLFITLFYVYIVKYRGPEWMKNRQPYDLKNVIRAYNVCMVILNIGFVVFFFRNTYLSGGYSYFCTGIHFKRTEEAMAVLSASWWYLHMRIAEMSETIFFVLRKKTSQVSFLHVVHHSFAVWLGWLGLTFGAEGQPMLCVCLNSLVHVIMYTYYFLSSFGPAVRPYLWWKRYLTQLQIIQLSFFVVYMAVPLLNDCNYPKFLASIGVSVAILNVAMFCHFFLQTYKTKKSSKME